MEFWMSTECDKSAYKLFKESQKILIKKVAKKLVDSQIGSLNEIAFIPVIVEESTRHFFPEIIKYTRKSAEVELRVWVDLKDFLQSNLHERHKLLVDALVGGLNRLSNKIKKTSSTAVSDSQCKPLTKQDLGSLIEVLLLED